MKWLRLVRTLLADEHFHAGLGVFQLFAARLAELHAAREQLERPVERQISRLQFLDHFLQLVARAFEARDRLRGLLTFGHRTILTSPRRRQDRRWYLKKNGAPLPVWSRSLACGNTISGAPAAYCFDIHTRRASRTTRLSAPEHHRYVQVLDWKVSREFQITACEGAANRLQVQAD